MQVVGPGFDIEVGYRGLPAIILSAHGASLQLELADRFSRRTEFVVVATGKVGTANRNALNQDLVRVLLAAVDRTFEGAARRSRQAGKDETLNLPLPVIHEDRPALVFLD